MKLFPHPLFFIFALFLPISVSAKPDSEIGQTSQPAFSHPAGTFTGSVSLELSADEGAVIYYTTDGTLPDSTNNEYAEPILFSGTMMVRARAYYDGYDPSEVVTKIYSRLDHTVSNFSSDLPLVIVHQFDVEMIDICETNSRGQPIDCDRTVVYFTVIDRDEDGRAKLLSDDLHLHSRSESNYRGTSSLELFPKRQFGVRLIDDNNENRNEPILGMPSENNWIMYAPYDDKSLIRNAVAYQLSVDMGRYAPRTRFVELFLHSGNGAITRDHYHGVYMLTERIKWDNNRVNIAKLTSDDNYEPEVTGGYIINYDRDVHFRSTANNTGFALVRPQNEDITTQQRDWIANYIGELESALFGDNYRDSDEGYAAFLDMESFVDHHLITETLKEMDGFRLSTYMYKDREGLLKMGPVWDYNISMGNIDFIDTGWEPQGWYHQLISESQYLNGWYSRLFEDPDFEDRYRERWWELRQGPFSTEHIISMIRDYADKLDESQKRNFERWPILGRWIWPNYFVAETYEEEINFLTNWITKRLNWIDSQMGPEPEITENQLQYYWYFGESMVNNTPLVTIESDYSLINTARIHYYSALEGYPFYEGHSQWRKASLERRNRPTDINYQPKGNYGRTYDPETTRALQVRQPFKSDGGENTLIFELPTTEMENVIFRFAALDEGAADALIIDYSTGLTHNKKSKSISSGTKDQIDDYEWTSEGLPTNRHSLSHEYKLYELDFSDISQADDNPDFKIRIRFDGDNMAADEGNRVTFNNFSLESAMDTPDTTKSNEGLAPHTFRLEQNYPNPFNPVTIITYALEERTEVQLNVYNILGQKVSNLVDSYKEPGEYSVNFDASNLASGVYLYELQAHGQQITRMMTLLK